ncbi:hypothetical protein ACFX1W_037522 [Malus domestica]
MQPALTAMPQMAVASSHLTTHPQVAYNVSLADATATSTAVTYAATSSQAAGGGRSGRHQHHVIISCSGRGRDPTEIS